MEIQTYLQASKENCLKYIVHSWVKWEILILLDMLAKYPNSWPKSIIISFFQKEGERKEKRKGRKGRK